METFRQQRLIDGRVAIDRVRAEDPRFSWRYVRGTMIAMPAEWKVPERAGIIAVVGLCEARSTGGGIGLFFLQVNNEGSRL